jgi:hypothetical protein
MNSSYRPGAVAALIMLVLSAQLASAQDTAGVGMIRGTVTTAAGRPAVDVGICIASLSRCLVTDDRGAFAFADLRPARYEVEIVAAGRAPLVSPVSVRAGLDVVLEVALPSPTTIEETITVSAPAFVASDEIKTSGFLASGAEVAQNAGGLQDVARFVQTLPGVAIGTDDFRNDLIVRGGSPLENLYIVDNVEIPNINTFANFSSAGGTVSMIDAALVQDVTFLTGGFPSVYGTRTSSVLQVALREGNRQRTAGRVTFGFAGAGGVVEGPLGGRRGSFIVSARRSVLDLVTDDTGIGGVPVLYTVNAKALFDVTARDRVWLLNVSGFDRIRLGATESSDLTSELSNLDIAYRGRRHATGLNWQRTFGANGVGLLGVTYARAAVQQRVGDLVRAGLPAPGTSLDDQLTNAQEVFRESSGESDLTLKYDLTAYAGAFGKLQLGGYARRTTIDYDAASPYGNEGPFFVEPASNPFALQERRDAINGGGYAQLSRRIASRWGVTAGLRADRFGYLPATRVVPRFGASFDLTRTVSARLSAGRFTQQPFLVFVTAFPANRQLEPITADHVVGGFSITTDARTRITVEGYYKRYADYPVSTDVPPLSLANVGDTFAVREVLFPMLSKGRGEAYGVELFAERKPDTASSWYGQANLAWSRSRYSGLDGVLRPSSFDYPVVANALGTYRLSRNWDASTRLAFLAGRPYTPIDTALSTAGRRAIYQLDRVNALRAPAYFRVDLRIDRRWTVNGLPVSLFAGMQNLTNRKNVSGYGWDRRGASVRTLEQLGLFPIAGLDWQF